MEEYGLEGYGFELVISSGSGMTTARKRAIDNDEWIVVTGRNSHWSFGRCDLHDIAAPKGLLSGIERADILARQAFYRESTEVYEMLERITIPLNHVQKGHGSR